MARPHFPPLTLVSAVLKSVALVAGEVSIRHALSWKVEQSDMSVTVPAVSDLGGGGVP